MTERRRRYADRVTEMAADIARWRGRGERVALATVVGTTRSAPRPVGAKLAISETGELSGSVSGGCVEPDVYEHARDVIATGRPKLLSYGIADDLAWDVGLPCGGEIDVFVEPLAGDLSEPGDDDAAALVTVIDGEPLGAKVLVRDGDEGHGLHGELTEQALERIRTRRSGVLELGGRKLFCDVYAPPTRLLVFDAVDLAEALCRFALALGWRTIVADARPTLATRERIPTAGELVVGWPDDVLRRVRPDGDTAIVVLTHEERFDVPALAGVLATEAFYVGALGSRRTQARRREQLREAGVREVDVDRIAGPCGLDLGAESPAETALSILAEILAVRAGRTGGPLAESSGPIHAATA